MPTTGKTQREEHVFTLDTRPLAQDASNRPEDAVASQGGQVHPAVLAAAAAAERWQVRRDRIQRISRPVVAPEQAVEPADVRHDLLIQVASVFGYAMVGAVLFHVGWWLVAGG